MHFIWMSTLLVSIVGVLIGRRLAPSLGLVDAPNERKKHVGTIPLVGGIAIFAAICVALVLSGEYIVHLPFLAAAALIVATGVWDDVRGVSPYLRLAIQMVAVGILAVWGHRYVADLGYLLPGDEPLRLGRYAIPFTIFGGVALINAFNMTDGLDGLCGSLTLAALFGALTMAASVGTHHYEVRFLVIVSAAIAGFLIFNFPFPGRAQASAFLGDAGSYLLGLSVLYVVILLSQGDDRAMPPVSALWFCLLPLLDMGGISIRRLMRRKSPFKADREHLHHIFTLAKFSAAATTGALAAVALLGVLVGTTLVFAGIPEGVSFLLFLGVAGLYLWHLIRTWKRLRFLKRSIDRRVFDRRAGVLEALSRLTGRQHSDVPVEGANDPVFERRSGGDRRARTREEEATETLAQRNARQQSTRTSGAQAPPGS